MRVLIVLTDGKPLVLDMNPVFDTVNNEYFGELANGGDARIPREKVQYITSYTSDRIEDFRYHYRLVQDAYASKG